MINSGDRSLATKAHQRDAADQDIGDNVTADLLGELLRTPAVRQLIEVNLTAGPHGTASQTTATLLQQDMTLTMAVAASLPARLNQIAEAAAELGRTVDRLPPELVRQLVQGWLEQLDDTSLRRDLAALPGALLRQVWQHEPSRRALLTAAGQSAQKLLATVHDLLSAYSDKPTEITQEIVDILSRDLDWGMVRRCLELGAERASPLLAATVNRVADDPLAVAGLALGAAAWIRVGATVTADALDALAFPPELLASALLSLLQGSDARTWGRLVNGVARQAVAAQRGDRILGDRQPRSEEIWARFVDEFTRELDAELAWQAVEAVAHNLHGTATLVNERLSGDDRRRLLRLAAPLAQRLAEKAGPWLNGALETLDHQPEAVDRAVEQTLGRLDPERLERATQGVLDAGQRALRDHPELARALVRPLLATVARSVRSRVTERLRSYRGPGKGLIGRALRRGVR